MANTIKLQEAFLPDKNPFQSFSVTQSGFSAALKYEMSHRSNRMSMRQCVRVIKLIYYTTITHCQCAYDPAAPHLSQKSALSSMSDS